MAKIKVYQPLQAKENGKWYKVWIVSDDMPLSMDLLREGPSPDLTHPKYDFSTGKWVDDELSVMDDMQANSAKLESAMTILLSKTVVTDDEALVLEQLYPDWDSNAVKYEKDKSIVQHEGLWRCIKNHTSQPTWAPSIDTASLWTRIELEHTGALDDPIPAQIPMEYFAGKIYSEDGKLYNCTRDSGQPLAYLPSALVGQYFEDLN